MASIDDQISELKKLAKENTLNVVDTLFESKSAKNPVGRVVFNQMLERVHKGEANGIICWKLNRLARNPVDGGQISWMLQQGTIQHVQTYGRSYYPTDNVLMMAVELGMANQFVRDLSVDTKRGLRNRAEKGLPNGVAHIGFLNDLSKEKGNRDWKIDPIRHPLVKTILTMMLTGRYSVRELHSYAKDELKLTTPQRKNSGGKPISLSYLYVFLKDPIHAGFFFQENNGGKKKYKFTNFEPMITEDEYWKIQDMLGKKGVPRITNRRAVYNYFAKCGTCNGNLSTDFKFQVICSSCKKKFSHLNRDHCPSCDTAIEKMAKPTFLTYVFYYCINHKKGRTKCPENGIEERNLEQQLLSDMEQKLVISKELSTWCIDNISKLKDDALDDAINLKKNLEQERTAIEGKLRRLTMLRISSDHSLEESQDYDALEKELRQELSLLELKVADTNIEWMDEAKRDFNLMSEVLLIIKNGTVEQKKDLLFAFGSNLTISAKKLTVRNKKSIEAFKDCLLLAKAENKAFEPAVFRLNKRQNAHFEGVTNSLLRAARELRTVILSGWKSYELEAAVKMMRGEAPFDGAELK